MWLVLKQRMRLKVFRHCLKSEGEYTNENYTHVQRSLNFAQFLQSMWWIGPCSATQKWCLPLTYIVHERSSKSNISSIQYTHTIPDLLLNEPITSTPSKQTINYKFNISFAAAVKVWNHLDESYKHQNTKVKLNIL